MAATAGAYSLLGTNLLWLNCIVLGVTILLLAIRIIARTFSPWYGYLTELSYLPLVVNSILNLLSLSNVLRT